MNGYELFTWILIGFIILWAASKIIFGVYFQCRKAYIEDVKNILKENASGQNDEKVRVSSTRQFNYKG